MIHMTRTRVVHRVGGAVHGRMSRLVARVRAAAIQFWELRGAPGIPARRGLGSDSLRDADALLVESTWMESPTLRTTAASGMPRETPRPGRSKAGGANVLYPIHREHGHRRAQYPLPLTRGCLKARRRPLGCQRRPRPRRARSRHARALRRDRPSPPRWSREDKPRGPDSNGDVEPRAVRSFRKFVPRYLGYGLQDEGSATEENSQLKRLLIASRLIRKRIRPVERIVRLRDVESSEHRQQTGAAQQKRSEVDESTIHFERPQPAPLGIHQPVDVPLVVGQMCFA